MDVAALATSILTMQAGQTQMMVAATMARQSAQAEASVVQILTGTPSLANVGAGIGGHLNLSV